jgi:PIN domain nuclease of toxin-antitoxin system
VISLFEVAVKHSTRRNGVPLLPQSSADAAAAFEAAGYLSLPLTRQHAIAVEALPLDHVIRSTGCSSRRR